MVLAIEGFAIEVTSRWGIHLLIGHITFVLVESFLCFPLSFAHVNPGWALVTDDFIDDIYSFAIDWRGYVPALSRVIGFMSFSSRTETAHYTAATFLVAGPSSFCPISCLALFWYF